MRRRPDKISRDRIIALTAIVVLTCMCFSVAKCYPGGPDTTLLSRICNTGRPGDGSDNTISHRLLSLGSNGHVDQRLRLLCDCSVSWGCSVWTWRW